MEGPLFLPEPSDEPDEELGEPAGLELPETCVSACFRREREDVRATVAEWQFWSLWLTGERANATVASKEERVVAWVVSRRGRAYPLIETGIHYRFADATGQQHDGCVWLREGAEKWQPGNALPVMYARPNGAQSLPSDFSFYWSFDTTWQLMSLLASAGVFGVVVSVWVGIRLRNRRWRKWALRQAAALARVSDDGETTL